MEANGKQLRLDEAKENKEFLKLIFQYPSSDKAVIKRGYVKECYNDGFWFNEIYDGLVFYSYQFIVEIKVEEQHG